MEALKNHHQLFDLLPNEVIVNTFTFIDADTLFDCRLVCKRWKELIDEYAFQEKAARENEFMNDGRGYYSFSQINSNDIRKLDLPWYVFYVIIKYDPFNRNLVKNHCGQGGLNHWGNITNTLWSMPGDFDMFNFVDMSCIQQIPQDNRYVLSDPDFDGYTSCFVIDFQYLRTIDQQIIFKDYGLNEIVMKTLRPKISFSAWYYRDNSQHISYTLRATVHSRTNEIIGLCDNVDTGLQREFGWNKVSNSFEIQGDETSLILHHSIMDSRFSCSMTNFKMSCSVVKIPLPIKYKNVNSYMYI
ncbi:F-box only protein 6-like [Rhopalosiphum maidis]|uniref:F-box only protein 6-like n=1 Tax=Rhopalosiphum maidis TaxID=43146 RepID=UPI000EFDED76|nr:F-box only protein 6-like isoform X1 [Rhopalosiphum maidis]XP_026821495.1 F-box only protein 6-like [Rhopalosiphum maidis]XP_026821518.1 F-box only protein 6-like [Rhopalosiphum maidis]XP_026821519.1 F-box only protein 6-like [Rhopalosiphum maidis]XP_026821520.1 F-box only protein 6-like [Rhopalosiphum maidis]XP_026821521.1 F-box only protein 6-like [Rhopalosiphum maidis]